MSEIKNYRKKNIQPMRPYIVGEDMTGISVNKEDTPELGGMIAVNPKNSEDRWYVAKQFFEDNYIEAPEQTADTIESLQAEVARQKRIIQMREDQITIEQGMKLALRADNKAKDELLGMALGALQSANDGYPAMIYIDAITAIEQHNKEKKT